LRSALAAEQGMMKLSKNNRNLNLASIPAASSLTLTLTLTLTLSLSSAHHSLLATDYSQLTTLFVIPGLLLN